MRWLAVMLVALGAALAACGGGDGGSSTGAAAATPRPTVDRFNSRGAFGSLKRQVELGPRPAGSAASRALAEWLRRALPGGRFQPVPGGLRNVVGRVPGRNRRRIVVVGAHYDTKDIPGFVGANDGASGVAVLTQLARHLKRRRTPPRSTLVFIAFDGEESPAGTPDEEFVARGLRGSRAAAPRYASARAMVLIDFVGERDIRIPREQNSDEGLWRRLRASARRVGASRAFPPEVQGGIADDHLPFLQRRVPSIDLIDFDFACFHRTCDDLSKVSERSLDAVGETLMDLLPRL